MAHKLITDTPPPVHSHERHVAARWRCGSQAVADQGALKVHKAFVRPGAPAVSREA